MEIKDECANLQADSGEVGMARKYRLFVPSFHYAVKWSLLLQLLLIDDDVAVLLKCDL